MSRRNHPIRGISDQVLDILRMPHRNHAKRGVSDQVFDILSFLRTGPELGTHIIYGTNINYRVFKEFLACLLEEGLVEFTAYSAAQGHKPFERRELMITKKGVDLLKASVPFFELTGTIRERRRRS